MPRIHKRFAVGQFMKAKRDIAVQLAKEKASALSEIKVEQQKVRRLNEKVSLFCELSLRCYKLKIIQYQYVDPSQFLPQ